MLILLKIFHRLQAKALSLFGAKRFVWCAAKARNPVLHHLAEQRVNAMEAAFPVKLRSGLSFRNDLGVAAGFDKDGKLLPFLHSLGAGFVVVGTVLPRVHCGNLPPELGGQLNPWTPLPSSRSAINSLGLPQVGVDATAKNIEAFRAQEHDAHFRIAASVMAHPFDQGEYAVEGVVQTVRKLAPLVDFFELNESCPNVAHHDTSLEEQQMRVAAVQAACAEFSKPLFVKLSTFGDVRTTLRFFADLKVAGLVGVNTQIDYDALRSRVAPQDHALFDYYTQVFRGGVSGAAIAPVSHEQIVQASLILLQEKLPLELIHVGGIVNHADVVESRKYAVLREWYTGLLLALGQESARTLYRKMVRGAE